MIVYDTHRKRVDSFPSREIDDNNKEKCYEWYWVDRDECYGNSLVVLVLVTIDHFYIIKIIQSDKNKGVLV